MFIKKVLRRIVLFVISCKNRFLIKRFKQRHGYPLNLENPKTFSEKIQWIKIFGHLEKFSKYVDKYDVREFVKNRCGEELLIPIIGVYKSTDEIDFGSLPKSFIMKATHGSNWSIIVENKAKINWNSAKEKMDEWVKSNYYYKFKYNMETNYKPLKGRILIEEYIEDPSGDLKDFKFFCYNGEPKYVQVDGNRFTDHRRDFYDIGWNRLPMKCKYENLPQPVDKPEKLDDMIAVCRKLSRDFPFVRVDLYFTSGRNFFGELTFTPENGMKRKTPVEYDYMLGELISLSSYNKSNAWLLGIG